MRFVQLTVKRSTVGAGETITIIPIGHGVWELSAMSVLSSVEKPSPTRLVWGYEIAGTGDYEFVHLKSGYATGKFPLSLDSPKEVEGPGGVASVVLHDLATEFHDLYVAMKQVG